uniref:Secreted protein n=1 Tax=Panagrellus redivivus TaxID=6233 RepID=A0A7E4W178_PANRE
MLLVTLLLGVFCGISAENVYCTYYRQTNEITCGTVTCPTHVPPDHDLQVDGIDAKLPLGWVLDIGISTQIFRSGIVLVALASTPAKT